MTDKEKLIELLDIIIQPGQKTLGDIADHLLSHGVTVREPGRWIDNCYYNTCSVCQKSVHVWNDDGDMQNFDFCPNCGAPMNGGADQ